MFEYLNSPSTVAPVSFATCGGFAKSRSGDKTFAQQYAGTTDELREIVDEVRRYMVEQGDNVSENELKLYLAIKKVCNIVCVEVNRTRVILHIHLDPDTVKLGDIVIDAREKGHWVRAIWSAAFVSWTSWIASSRCSIGRTWRIRGGLAGGLGG